MKRHASLNRDVVQEVEIIHWNRGHTMASNVQGQGMNAAQRDVEKVAKTAEKKVKPLQQFLNKFKN